MPRKVKSRPVATTSSLYLTQSVKMRWVVEHFTFANDGRVYTPQYPIAWKIQDTPPPFLSFPRTRDHPVQSRLRTVDDPVPSRPVSSPTHPPLGSCLVSVLLSVFVPFVVAGGFFLFVAFCVPIHRLCRHSPLVRCCRFCSSVATSGICRMNLIKTPLTFGFVSDGVVAHASYAFNFIGPLVSSLLG